MRLMGAFGDDGTQGSCPRPMGCAERDPFEMWDFRALGRSTSGADKILSKSLTDFSRLTPHRPTSGARAKDVATHRVICVYP